MTLFFEGQREGGRRANAARMHHPDAVPVRSATRASPRRRREDKRPGQHKNDTLVRRGERKLRSVLLRRRRASKASMRATAADDDEAREPPSHWIAAAAPLLRDGPSCHADDGEWVEVHEEEHAPSVLRRALRRIAALFWR